MIIVACPVQDAGNEQEAFIYKTPLAKQIMTFTSVSINQVCSVLTIFALMNVCPWWWKANQKLLDLYLQI